jgi:hypothetical protein
MRAGYYKCTLVQTDVQREYLLVSFTSTLSQQQVWFVEFKFITPMKCEEAVQAVKTQFGLGHRNLSSSDLWNGSLNEHVQLQFNSRGSCNESWNWYTLQILDTSLKSRDDALIQQHWEKMIEEQRQSAPEIKF